MLKYNIMESLSLLQASLILELALKVCSEVKVVLWNELNADHFTSTDARKSRINMHHSSFRINNFSKIIDQGHGG
jgi:hypothetical protein